MSNNTICLLLNKWLQIRISSNPFYRYIKIHACSFAFWKEIFYKLRKQSIICKEKHNQGDTRLNLSWLFPETLKLIKTNKCYYYSAGSVRGVIEVEKTKSRELASKKPGRRKKVSLAQGSCPQVYWAEGVSLNDIAQISKENRIYIVGLLIDFLPKYHL